MGLADSPGDYNLEEEYGWFLDGVLKYADENPDDFLEHFGVKGMHWGVRKADRPRREPLTNLGPDKIVRKTARGEELTLTKNPPMAIHKALARMSKTYREDYKNFASLTISDGAGKKVGTAQVYKKSADELNLVWLGIDKSARGKGYATAAMKTAEEFGRQSGFKKLTLEVPGNSPDARHIYSKLGFKVTREATPEEIAEDPSWGGLTMMEYRIDQAHHASTSDLGANFLAHYGIKGMHWGQVRTRQQIDSDSHDVVQVKAAKAKIKTNHTTNVLSNQELQAVVTRMNLEQQYSKLTAPNANSGTAKLKKAGFEFAKSAAIEKVEAPITAMAKEKYGNMGELAVKTAFKQMKTQEGKKKGNGNG